VFRVRRMWRPRGELKPRYDVVIVGGGSHGRATAYYLARNHGITNVAVLEQSYIGSGAAGRNTTIVRSNYRTPEGAAFYKRSVDLYEGLSRELDFNLLFSQQGHLTLAHSERAMVTMTERAEVNQLLGIDSRVVFPDEIARLCPELDLSDGPTWPIMGALYHAPGGIIRHDAVVWGFARAADRGGVEIHPYTTYRSTSTFPFLEYSARHVLELFPQLEQVKVLRQWTGLCDISPDYSPILGKTDVDGFHLSAGWGTYGFKAAPIVGTTLAELVATGRTPDLIAPFALERFHTDTMVSELAAAAVSH